MQSSLKLQKIIKQCVLLMQMLGLDVDGNVVNLALLNSKKEILDLNSFQFSDVKPLYIDKKLANKNLHFVTGLDANKVIVKHKNLKMIKKKAIEKALPFQTEISSSLSKEKSIILPVIGKKHANTCDLLFYITTKKALKDHLDILSKTEIDPDFVSSKANGLINFAKNHFPEKAEICLLHIGNTQTTLVHMENSLAKASYFIKVGAEDLLKDQNKTDGIYASIDFSKIPMSQHTKLHNAFFSELTRGLYSFFEKNKSKKIPLFITGNIGSLKNFDQFIFLKFSNYFTESLEFDKPMQLPFAISIGLSMEALDGDKRSLQFRQNEFMPQKHLKHIGKSLISFFICAAVVSILIYFQGLHFIGKKNELLQKNISFLEENEKLHLSSLSSNQLQITLDSYEKKIERETRDFPYYLNFPKISSVLMWINTHPKLKTKKNEYIEIKHLSYELIGKKNDEALSFADAKVHFEFAATDSLAQNFHTSLLKDSRMVDIKKEISWEQDKNLYKTSFYLKKAENYDQ